MTSNSTEKSSVDHTTLMRPRESSDDDITILGSQDMELGSPYISSNGSIEDLETLGMLEYKSKDYTERPWILRQLSSSIPYTWKRTRYVMFIPTLLLLIILGTVLWFLHGSDRLQKSLHKSHKWVKPEGFKIVGMVFYGRPPTVSILDCYLKRNLVANGGFLDEVQWMANTDNHYDLNYLDVLVNSTQYYKKVVLDETGSWSNIWAHATDNNTLYIKIDDDMVYIHDDAIPRIVQTRLAHPEAYDIAANIVNSPLTNWLHYHTGAIWPYLPEQQAKPGASSLPNGIRKESWRASELPPWSGTPSERFIFPEDGTDDQDSGLEAGQRWLPLPNTAENLLKTPMALAEYNTWGRGWNHVELAIQQHYSLFENLEREQMSNYWFGNEEGIWNMQFERYNLNFLAIWGRDVNLDPFPKDDEEDYTVTFPKKHSRPLLIDSHSIVAHFSYSPQRKVYDTDLLGRYRAYANEMICAPDNQLHALELHYK